MNLKMVKKFSKIILSSAAVFAVALMVPVVSAGTQIAPEWNTGATPEEQNWFQVSNSTRGSDWGNSMAVSPGDVLAFRIYVHNNTCLANDAAGNERDNCPQTNARHTFVKVNLPANGGVVTATIGSDNSVPVLRNLTVNLPTGQTIAFKVGSVQVTQHPYNEFGWPDLGKTETVKGADNIATALDLGDIPGGYASSKFVVFQAQVSNVPATAATGQVLGASALPATGPEQVVGISLYLGYLGFLLRRLKLTSYF